MTLRPLAAALLAASALVVAACGDGEAPATAANTADTADPASADDKTRQAQVKFAQCMREQGVDMPDPGADGGLAIKVGPGSDIDPEEFEKASKECEQYRKDMRPNLSEEEQQEFKERALEHARCMREQGIDFPDPTFSAEGGAQVRMRRGSGVDPEDPKFQTAQEECGDLMGPRVTSP